LDNDGDLDVVINCLNGPPLLYRNDSDRPRIAVRLKGIPPNTKGIGARIKFTGFGLPQSQQILAGGRYLASDQPLRVFAAGSATNELTVEVMWRSGLQTIVDHVPANCCLEVDEKGAAPPRVAPPIPPQPLFRDVSSLLNHRHHENNFGEFERQPLLPKMSSQLGPGLAWYDLDGDEHDDLILGSGAGGSLAAYHNQGNGTFTLVSDQALTRKTDRDQTSILGWTPAPGQRGLLVGLSNYEDAQSNAPALLSLAWSADKPAAITTVPGNGSSTGPLTVADVNGNGDLALFVGGRIISGHYPESAASRLLRQSEGQLTEAPVDHELFANLGLVSSAVFSDLDGDGLPELILACEWGPVRVFKNARGCFHEITKNLGLDHYLGWWNGVATGDLDGDGKMDIVAANWGLNSPYHPSPEKPLQLYYGDFDGDGLLDYLEAEYEGERVLPRRDLFVLGAVFPALRHHFPTHHAFGEASLTQILKAMRWQTRTVEATTLSSMVFMNRGTNFQAVPLPAEAQFAPAFCPCIADFDGDGHQDLFLSQNFFDLAPDMPRLDGGQGLLLKGNGSGGFEVMSSTQSGLAIYGEQRGTAFGDYDEDGRLDLAVTQNGAETRLFHNVRAIPGLRVRLKGPPGNPSGIGAQLRLKTGSSFGPTIEIQAGSGYWAQNSSVALLPAVKSPAVIEARWPGGRLTRTPVSPEAKEVRISAEGKE
jgi:enediyne biosynthesis protein E4